LITYGADNKIEHPLQRQVAQSEADFRRRFARIEQHQVHPLWRDSAGIEFLGRRAQCAQHPRQIHVREVHAGQHNASELLHERRDPGVRCNIARSLAGDLRSLPAADDLIEQLLMRFFARDFATIHQPR